jgi:MbtH protein
MTMTQSPAPGAGSFSEISGTNPFDDDGGEFIVLRNAEWQHSLWPALYEIPEGWESVHGSASRQDCLAYVDSKWTDMRPRSLRDAMGG